ncbi:hypothetical protein [Sphingobium phenoxybenzoativorans]|uniref:hypothetical protein n=1 Tax=Sphingobium phenoxybenzoativorans TaxID=1592790 RepID=UPI000872334A|nr:hypothetical protein [Sphingobium phenoxybenzoativorans]
MAEAGLAPMIAVVGCDGSGKSTLSADLLAWLRESREVDTVYLGLRSGEIGNRIKRWPLIGRAFERQLSKKAGQAREKGGKIPGAPTAFVIYMFSVKRMRAFNRMLALRRKGVTIVTDRYPQVEVPGFYDGPGLSAARAEGWLVSLLARRERAMYERMISHVPDLVIRLNVDVDTAFARKPDHKRASLEAKVAVTPHLRFNGAKIIDLCSTDPYPVVLEQAKAAVMGVLSIK